MNLPDLAYEYYYENDDYEKFIGECSHCKESVTSNDDAYELEDILLHRDCVFDFLESYKVNL